VINPEELLEETQTELEELDYDEERTGMDRRHFVFFSLVAAAAATLGVEPAQAERLGIRAARAGGSLQMRRQAQQQAALALGKNPAVTKIVRRKKDGSPCT
jgi:hypothetical protein